MLEELEKRRLLAGQIVNPGASGILQIDGTAGDDTIVITNVLAVIHVDYGGGVTEDWDPAAGGGEFHSIIVNAGTGNDSIDSTALLSASGINGVSMNGEAGDDTLLGGEGDDTMDGGAGADLMVGNGGNDTVTYASRTAAVSVTFDDVANDGEAGENDLVDHTIDTVIGGAGNDTISAVGEGIGREFHGGAGNDSLIGGDGPDSLFGGDGDDTMDGGLGGDLLFGENGNDTVTYASRTNSVTVTIDGNADDGESGELDNVDTTVETVIGGAGNDTLDATGVATAVNLQGNAGDDVITGGDGDDNLDGGAGHDTIDGGAGNDVIHGDGGNDSLVGGADSDTIFGDNNNDTITGGIGNDSLVGGAGDDSLLGEAGNDSMSGNQGSDDFSGGTGIDWVDYSYSTLGITVTIDGVANDGAGKSKTSNVELDVENVQGGSGADRIIGSGKGNILSGLAGNDTLSGGNSGDILLGGAGDDCLIGNTGPDTLTGGDGNDRMFSSFGNKRNDGVTDVVDGGLGTDTLTRDGSDTVVNVETLL